MYKVWEGIRHPSISQACLPHIDYHPLKLNACLDICGIHRQRWKIKEYCYYVLLLQKEKK